MPPRPRGPDFGQILAKIAKIRDFGKFRQNRQKVPKTLKIAIFGVFMALFGTPSGVL